MYDDVMTRNDDNELAVRTVSSSGDNGVNPNDVFTRDDEGRLCMRTVGGSGGGGGGITQVRHDDTLKGKGTSAEPLGISDEVMEKIEQGGGDFVPQYDTMPTASADNVGEIAQYSGETISDVQESAVVAQTVGSGLSDLSVDVDKFVETEQPSGSETVSFVCDSVEIGPEQVSGSYQDATCEITNPQLFIQKVEEYWNSVGTGTPVWGYGVSLNPSSELVVYACDFGQLHSAGFTIGIAQDYGIVYNAPTVFPDTVVLIESFKQLKKETVVWSKNETTVDLEEYGISYSGTPDEGDTISVAYTPFVAGITNGYFYKNYVEYSDPVATISQTVGSGLTDLSVNVDKFVEAEQPTQSGNTSFVVEGIQTTVNPLTLSQDVSGEHIEATINPVVFFAKAREVFGDSVVDNGNAVILGILDDDWNMAVAIDGDEHRVDGQVAEDWGVVYNQTPSTGIAWLYYTIVREAAWTKNGNVVTLSEYGISYSGTPAVGDTLTVAYTAPALIGYSWKQTDVQPSSGNAGIEWKTKVDLPAEYSGDIWTARPYYTISGGLPDGEYEFYLATKTAESTARPNGAVVFKAKVKIDNQNNRCFGNLGYVFDGNYMLNVNRRWASSDLYVNSWVYKNGSDLIFYGDQVFETDILNYNEHQTVPECFMLSAIKNIETGKEYIASGAINLDGSYPQFDTQMDSNLFLMGLSNPPHIPERQTQDSLDAASFGVNTVYFERFGSAYSVITMNHRESDSWFVVEYIGGYNGSQTTPYVQRIIKATGIFKNCYLADDEESQTWVAGVDTTTAATLTGYVYVMRGVISSGGSGFWFGAIPQNTTPIAQIGPQGYRLGTITVDGLGNIIQYVGETDSNYTNGYYYKASGTVVVVPEGISPSDYNISDWTCGVTNMSSLVSALAAITGWSENSVRDSFKDSGTTWKFVVSFDGTDVTVNSASFGFTGTDNPDVLQYLTATYSGGDSQVSAVVVFNPNYTPESTEVQNPSWNRVDVQPLDLTGVSGYDATKTQVLKNVQGVLTWVDE